MNRSTFDIHDEVLRLRREVEEGGEDMTDQQEIKLGELQVEQRTKMLSTGMWARDIKLHIEKLKQVKKEISERLKVAENTEKRLKDWVFKQAVLAKIVKGDENIGWKGEKVESEQIQISWRRSEQVMEYPQHREHPNLLKNFPHLFRFTVKPANIEGGRELMDLISLGLVEEVSHELSKSTAKKQLQGKIGIAGLGLVKRINPQIKA